MCFIEFIISFIKAAGGVEVNKNHFLCSKTFNVGESSYTKRRKRRCRESDRLNVHLRIDRNCTGRQETVTISLHNTRCCRCTSGKKLPWLRPWLQRPKGTFGPWVWEAGLCWKLQHAGGKGINLVLLQTCFITVSSLFLPLGILQSQSPA